MIIYLSCPLLRELFFIGKEPKANFPIKKKSTSDNKSEVLSIMPQTGIEPVLDLTRTGF